MLFQFNKPSISAIRATLLIDKLNSLTQQNISISLCATGRTGSGKTTLGNRLVGIDYFMPSTGQQDCTDEINLVEFPVGLKYFDLPGACSNETLENYNRAALGIEQRDDCPSVESLTLARYSQGSQNNNVQKQKFPVATFQQSQLQPDLILYIIAPHQQLLAIDCIYLRDLLDSHTQVIFIFNMFINKDTKSVLATDQNIIDATNRIKRVCASVLGANYQPIITPVNCWTGEGISDLLKNAYNLLGSQKGKLLEEVIQYQQQNTGNEYVRQVKLELLRLFAHTACQKPEGIYTCDQPFHQDCRTLYNFLSELQAKSAQTSYQLGEKISALISSTLSALTSTDNNRQEYNPLEDEHYFLATAIEAINNEINYLNDKINSCLIQSQQDAREFRDREVNNISDEIDTHSNAFDLMQQGIQTSIYEYNSRIDEMDRVKQDFQASVEKHNKLVEKVNSLNEEISSDIDDYNYKVNSLNQLVVEISNLANQFDLRCTRLSVRIDAYNRSIQTISSNIFLQIDGSTSSSIKAESDSIDREQESISAERTLIEKKIERRDRESRVIQQESIAIEKLKEQRDNLQFELEKYQRTLSNLEVKSLEIFKSVQSAEASFSQKTKTRNKFRKYIEEKVLFYKEIIEYFDKGFYSIDTEIDANMKEIKLDLELIGLQLLLFGKTEAISNEDIDFFQKEINSCLQKMDLFKADIYRLENNIKSCAIFIQIHSLISKVMLESITNHFDSTGECEFKGTTYSYFAHKGIALLLTVAHSIVLNREIKSEYISRNTDILKQLNNLMTFSNNPTEGEIFRLLESKVNLLFDSDFERTIKQVAL